MVSGTNGTNTGPDVVGDQTREKFYSGQVIHLGGAIGIASRGKARGLSLNPGAGENYFA